MEVAYFAQQDFLPAGSAWDGDKISIFHSYDGLVESKMKPDAFVIGIKDPVLAQQLLLKLRANTTFYLSPIFLERKMGGAPGVLVDGIAPSASSVKRKTEAMNLNPAIFDLPSDDRDVRLLNFLSSRPLFSVLPVADWNARGVYSFPLLKAIGDYHANQDAWLENLLLRDVIQADKLLDNVRYCDRCHSTHINYVDVCPVCSEADICEYSAASDESGEHTCHHCQHHFSEPHVLGCCMTCHQIAPLAQLPNRAIYSFSITQQGLSLIASMLQTKEMTKVVLEALVSSKSTKQSSSSL